jgi:L-lactate dehydrogenase
MSGVTNGDRIVIVGAGHVGATAAYALMLRALFREIVLIDSDPQRAEAEAEDLADANALARPATIRAGDYADAAGASIAVITAGAATHGDESRLSVATRSAVIVRDCVSGLIGGGFDGVIVVAANPVDLMSLAALEESGFPANRVIGTGTLLDSSRLRQAIAGRLDVAPDDVDAMILGEHGDSSVAALSTARIGGLTIEKFAAHTGSLGTGDLLDEVRRAGYRIIGGKGYTSYGIATAIVRICEAILRDERAVLPVSTLLTGQFGIDGLYLSLPCVLGGAGVERILTPDLDDDEIAALRASADAIQTALGTIGTSAKR